MERLSRLGMQSKYLRPTSSILAERRLSVQMTSCSEIS
nr:MAG TPA: hypothetical protein [Caudoviricetes sp.]